MRRRVAIAVLAAALTGAAGAATGATLSGTDRADLLRGTDGADRVLARGGDDLVAVEYDGARDVVSCGPGRDVVAADRRDRIGADCEVVSLRIHRDRFTNPESRHETQAEPDSLTVGATTVALFQVGRNRSGGAAAIGWATTRDAGRTWREGILPGLTTGSVPPGPFPRASDPVVAYDAARRVWLAHTLALTSGETRLLLHRSSDGLRWSGPFDVAVSRSSRLGFDKNWITCDNGAASPYRGRCYVAYTLVGEPNAVALQRSDDGGRTWSAAVTRRLPVTGVLPVVQPDGRLVLAFWSGMPTIGVEPGTGRLAIAYYAIHRNGVDAEVVTSANDGRSWSAPQRLNPRRMSIQWMPETTLGRMLADYIGVSWVRGRPLVVYVLASPPRNGKLRQAVYAARA